MSKYNGWKNYETWNVALWINNDEGLYNIAKDCQDFRQFANVVGIGGTLDGVSFSHVDLDIEALNGVISEAN